MEEAFKKSQDEELQQVVQNLFVGEQKYVTKCKTCNHSGIREGSFYEIDVGIEVCGSFGILRVVGKSYLRRLYFRIS
jgi:hypothetical protein